MMIRKRDGRVVEFDETKITDAIFEAAKSVGGADRQLAMELTLNVLKASTDTCGIYCSQVFVGAFSYKFQFQYSAKSQPLI